MLHSMFKFFWFSLESENNLGVMKTSVKTDIYSVDGWRPRSTVDQDIDQTDFFMVDFDHEKISLVDVDGWNWPDRSVHVYT